MNKSDKTAMLPDYEAIGKRIRARRKELNLTQEQLAEKVDLSIPHLSHIETGKTKLGLRSLILIANALRTSTDSLLYDSLDIMLESFDKDFKDLLEGCTVKERATLYEATKQFKKMLQLNS